MEPNGNDNGPPNRTPREFVFRPPWVVVDARRLERAVAAQEPAWRNAEVFAPPLPAEALTALELAQELLR